MNKPLAINKVAEQMGLTSRTLRHWESERLFSSTRAFDSGWRTYDDNAILCIQITALLRKIDIPIKEIKSVIDCMSISKLYEIVSNQLMVIDAESAEIIYRKKQLEQLLSFLSERSSLPISGEGKPYGYGFCASVSESVIIPEHLEEMTLPGGLYAVMESTDDIRESWKTLMNLLSKQDKYKSDRSRLCLEEHIRNDNPEGCGNEYSLKLMEPVKLK